LSEFSIDCYWNE